MYNIQIYNTHNVQSTLIFQYERNCYDRRDIGDKSTQNCCGRPSLGTPNNAVILLTGVRLDNSRSNTAAFCLASAAAIAQTAAQGDGLVVLFHEVSTHLAPVAAASHSGGASHCFVWCTPKCLAPVLDPGGRPKRAYKIPFRYLHANHRRNFVTTVQFRARSFTKALTVLYKTQEA